MMHGIRGMKQVMAWALLLLFMATALGCAARGHEGRDNAVMAAASAFEEVRDDPVRLRAFLSEFPKGGELHSHLSGAVYAEDFLRWSMEQGLCVSTEPLGLSQPPCGPGTQPAEQALGDAVLYGRMVDFMSNRDFDCTRAMWGHDNFFATFDRFGPASDGNTGKMLAQAMQEAGQGNVLYLELMKSFFPPELKGAARKAGWDGDPDATFERLRHTGVFETIPAVRAQIRAVEQEAARLVAGTSGQGVTVRWLEQCIRVLQPEAVFAQFAYAFALCRDEPHVVGFNLVAPEDNPASMRNYALHMRMIQGLRKHFPETSVTLHAGELRLGLVEPEGLRFHIRQAVEVAGAKRIGHGVDLPFEEDMPGLLAGMREKGVSVEICLSSNDQILGVKGDRHPLQTYASAGIPITLNTDDAGVARIDLTHEYQRAVQEHGFDYAAIVRASRNGLEQSFLPGRSLWKDADSFTPVDGCNGPDGVASQACEAALAGSEKGMLQLKLEKQLRDFAVRASVLVR